MTVYRTHVVNNFSLSVLPTMVEKPYPVNAEQKQEQLQLQQLMRAQSHEQETGETATNSASLSEPRCLVAVEKEADLYHNFVPVRSYSGGCQRSSLSRRHRCTLTKSDPILGKSRRGSGDGGGLSRICVALFFLVISWSGALGASVNPTLEDDLRMNGSHRGGVGVTATTTTTSRTTTSSSTTTTSTSAPRPSIRDTSWQPANGTTTAEVYRDNGHINFTIPIQAAPDSSIIVKHGSIVYEVINSNNRSVSTNVGSFSLPVMTSSGRDSTIYQGMTAQVIGLRVEEAAKGVTYEEGASKILANSKAVIRFFGNGFKNNTILRFVTEVGVRGTDCDDLTSTKSFQMEKQDLTEHSAVANVQLPPLDEGEKLFYVCVKEENADMPWVHQGPEQWIVLTSYQKWLPVWAHIILLVLLLCLSGLFSGLNLGLMAIDRTEIKIIINAGSEQERRHAKRIRPLRDNGNYLLCSLLLGNVLVNATLTILLDDLTSGLIAVIGSTVGIVIFGEIVPQAVCSRHGLAVGARTVWITKLFMAITFPLSYPISVILDKVLGEEIGNVYNRERLKELVRVTQGTNDLEKDEVNIISGALELKQKTAVDVMTKLEDAFMLPIDSVLDFDTVSEIMSNGYSRIPVYDKTRGNVISLLHAKDLAFVDPDDKMPLRTICEFYNNQCYFVFENVTLDVLFKVFKQGNKGHMAFVQRVKVNDKSDPIYEVCGLVTMEDVIEELIQEEINDETDVWLEDDHRRGNNGNHNAITDANLGGGWNLKPDGGTTVSPQLTLAAFQYLSTAVDEFGDTRISKAVLERLLKQNIYFHIKIKNKDTMKTDPSTILYETGKPADYFTMILEGKAHAEMGKERLIFESGPFSYFGTKCLSVDEVPPTPGKTRKTSQSTLPELPSAFVPDYTVRAVTDLTYFQISRSMYLAAKQATLLGKSYVTADTSVNTNDSKMDDQLQQQLEQVVVNTDVKPKDVNHSVTVSAPADSEDVLQDDAKEERIRQAMSVQSSDNHHVNHKPMIGDNNNICVLNNAKGNGDARILEKQEHNHELSNNHRMSNNMSRVILCPKDGKPLDSNHHNHPHDASFQGKIIVDGNEKNFCKL